MTRSGYSAESRRFLAVIADVQGSRDIADRAAFQRRLVKTLKRVNSMFRGERLPANFRITAGDEIQGLLANPADLVDVTAALADELHPVRLVFGAGWGHLATDLAADVATLDGPCFHAARRSVTQASRQGTWVQVEGFGDVEDEAVSAVFFLIGALRDGWTATQTKYARATRGKLQKHVAEHFDVSPSVISESLKSARFEAVLAGERALRSLLTRFGDFAEVYERSAKIPNEETACTRRS